MRWTLTAEECPILIREFLHRRHAISSRLLAKLKRRDDGILVNGRHATVVEVLNPGDVLEIACDDLTNSENESIEPANLPFHIVYEDEYIRVLNKEPYMPTHPAMNHPNDSLANAAAYDAKIKNEPFVFRPVSRLDRNTSGVVLTAKDQYTASELSRYMQSGLIHKTYVGIVCGVMPYHDGQWQEIENFICRVDDSLITRRVCEKDKVGAEYALSAYRVLAVNEEKGYSLVEAMPITGRTHQLRVHFSSLGYPIMGDGIYGTDCDIIGRQALHARAVSFVHPFTKMKMHVKAPLFSDMATLTSQFFGITF